MAVAAESVNPGPKQKRRKYSHHLCPKCRKETLERKPISAFLRIFRVFPGLNPRSYKCDSCGKKLVMWTPKRP